MTVYLDMDHMKTDARLLLIEYEEMEKQGFTLAASERMRVIRERTRNLNELIAIEERNQRNPANRLNQPTKASEPSSPSFMKKTEFMFDGDGTFIDSKGRIFVIDESGKLSLRDL